MGLTIIGVRHHSPACARLVSQVIEKKRPRYVLVEGPADMNGRMEELLLRHELPVAIFSYRSAAGQSSSSWSPFCEHSPEWVALREARRVDAEPLFIDLPAWHESFWEIRNRYSDRHTRASRLVHRLCERFAVSDIDALWDHLFERPIDLEMLAERLESYFEELRGDEPASEQDGPREIFMARSIAWAMNHREPDDNVVVVCGGYHAPELKRTWGNHKGEAWPDIPIEKEPIQVGSYLVPYSFHRLDSFAGYESGMPSPAYQDAVWKLGAEDAAETLLERSIQQLRKKKQPVSPADVIAVSTMANGLARLRGHEALTRSDLLDGLAAGLVKDALEVPLPWTYRGPIRPRTDPVLVEIIKVFSGDKVGRLAEGTPLPPLLHEVRAQLEAHDLLPGQVGPDVRIDLTEEAERERSRVLHRLRVLGIPGFERMEGPEWSTDGILEEHWFLSEAPGAEPTLIEASAYGATLESAAAAKLEIKLLAARGRLDEMAWLLMDLVFVGVDTLAERVLKEVSEGIGSEPSFDVVGRALHRLHGLWRHDALLGAQGSEGIATVIEKCFERGLWLMEDLQGPVASAEPAQIQAVVALRDALRHAGRLPLDPDAARGVMERRRGDDTAPPAIRGAAMGFLWSLFEELQQESEVVLRSIRRNARPDRPQVLGDYLAGLFALAREQVSKELSLMNSVDEVVGEMTEHDFIVALPSLRLAFGYFPPIEKEHIARLILRGHGGDAEEAKAFLDASVDGSRVAAAWSLEERVTEVARKYGIDDDD